MGPSIIDVIIIMITSVINITVTNIVITNIIIANTVQCIIPRPSIINIMSSPSIETPSSFCFVIMIAVQQSVVANAMPPPSLISYLPKYQVP